MKNFSKSIFALLVIYMVLPITIFILGWIKLWFSIPAVIIIAYLLFRMSKDKTIIPELPSFSKKEIETLILAILIIALWVYFSGIGKFVFQNDDHLYRNAVFEMLVNNKWPVIKNFNVDGVNTPFMFVYYIGFWMPAALIGKIFGITAGYCFQAIWAVIGIWLFYYLCCSYLKKVSLLPLIIFIFFSGLDVIGTAIMTGAPVSIFAGDHLEWWESGMQFSSFTTQLFWVFNQAIPAWILTILVLMQKKNRYIVFLLGVSLIFCPLPFIGIIPFAIYVIMRNAWQTKVLKAAITDLFTVENILGGGICGIITYLYFKTNSSGQHIVFLPAEIMGKRGFLFSVVLFIFLEIGVYIIAIYKYEKKNPLLYITFLFLFTCPLIQVGYGGDYCMRACIPGEIVLFLLVMKTIYKARKSKDVLIVTALIILLTIGAITPIHEINRTIQNTRANYNNNVPVYAGTYTEKELMMGNLGTNFRGKINNSFFAKHLAK